MDEIRCVGENIGMLLGKKNISRSYFAQEVGMKRQRLYLIVQGKAAPTVVELAKIAQFFGLSMEFFFIDHFPQLRQNTVEN